MKKISLFLIAILFAIISSAQVNYSTDFNVLNATPGEGQWDATEFGGNNVNSCSSYSMEDNCYGTGTSQIVEMSNTTSLGTALGFPVTVSFDYKVAEYNSSTAAPASDFKEIKVYSGISSTGPWVLQYTLSSHISSIFCATKSFSYTHPAGPVFLQFTFEHSNNGSSPDVDIFFDNVSVIEAVPANDITSKILASATLTEPATISSLINTIGAKVNVFDFTFEDMQSGDALATIIDQLLITKGGTNTVADWSTVIAGARLDGPDQTAMVGTVNANDITFATADMISIAEGPANAETYTLSIWLNTTVTDNSILDFKIANIDIITDLLGSSFGTYSVESGTETITVVATELAFVQQPTNVLQYVGMTPSVTISANDVNGNQDLDFTGTIVITSDGTLTGTPVSQAAVAGLATFASLTHTVDQTNRTLTATYTTPIPDWTATSTLFDVTANLCGSPSIPDDECATAPDIDLSQPFEGSTSCTYTVSAGSPGGCGVIDNDSWITFIAGSTDITLEYQVGSCSGTDGIQLVVFGGTCGSLVEIAGSCINPAAPNSTANWNFSGLTIGDTYYIRIDGYAGQLCDYSFTPISGIVIRPPNDECANAIALTCGGANDIQSNILATSTDNPVACTGGGTTEKGVWYTFTGDGQEFTISTDNAGTNFDTNLNIYTGTCGALVCVAGDTDGGTGETSEITFNSVNGTTYYAYVDADHTGATVEGQFEISMSCAIAASINVTGTVTYDNVATTAIAAQTVNLMQGATQIATTTTDASGNYTFTGVADGAYTVTPAIALTWGGVTAMDATHYEKHMLNITLLTGLKLESGDMNASTALTAMDVTQQKKRIVTEITSFAAGDWAYSGGSVTVSGVSQAVNVQTLCYGDANASYAFARSGLAPISTINDGVIYLDNQQYFEIPVRAGMVMNQLSSITLEIMFDEAALNISEIEMAINSNEMRFNVQTGIVRVVYSSLNAQDYAENDILFYIKGTVATLTEQINLAVQVNGEFGDYDDTVINNITLLIPELAPSGTIGITSIENNILIYPNPAKNFLNIENIKNSKVELTNIYGKVISTELPNSSSMRLNTEDLPNGTYFIKIYKNEEVVTRKFIVLK